MGTLSLRLPDSLHQKLKELAAREGISINQILTIAAAEKIAALATEEYLLARGSRGRKVKFRRILDKVPAGTPVTGDQSDG